MNVLSSEQKQLKGSATEHIFSEQNSDEIENSNGLI